VLVRSFQIPGGEPIPQDEWSLGPSAELVDFVPPPLQAHDVVGRRVDDVTPYFGTYGMGGPGFFALGLGDEWLVVSLWGAGDWLRLEGRLLSEIAADELASRLVGRTITALKVDRRSMSIGFDNGTTLIIDEDSSKRAPWPGTGKPRALAADEDLRDGVFLCSTAELWT